MCIVIFIINYVNRYRRVNLEGERCRIWLEEFKESNILCQETMYPFYVRNFVFRSDDLICKGLFTSVRTFSSPLDLLYRLRYPTVIYVLYFCPTEEVISSLATIHLAPILPRLPLSQTTKQLVPAPSSVPLKRRARNSSPLAQHRGIRFCG